VPTKIKKTTGRKPAGTARLTQADILAQAGRGAASAGKAGTDIMLHVSKAATIIDDKTGPRLGHISARTKSGGSLKSPPGCPGIASPCETRQGPCR
jgi:GTPase involved in cell partitioning and DNA repair